jgi:hypothetical protein
VLCLEEIPRPDFDFDGAWFRVGEQQIHLIVQRRTEMPCEDGHPHARRSHRAAGPQLPRTREHLRIARRAVRGRPHNKTPWPQIYLADPDGHTIELNAERLD